MSHFNKEFKVVLFVEDYDSAIFFYREAFGLLPNYTWFIVPDENGTRFYLGDGKLEVVRNPPPAKQGASCFLVQSTDVDGCFSIMKTFPGITVVEPPVDRPYGMRSFLVRDPAGNAIEVMQRLADIGKNKGEATREEIIDSELAQLFFLPNVEECNEFYAGLLGLPVEDSWNEGPDDRGYRYRAGKGYIELLSRPPIQPFGPGMVALEADNVDRCYDELAAKGASFHTDIRDTYDGRRIFRLLDPAGNIVEIYSYLEDIRDLAVAPRG